MAKKLISYDDQKPGLGLPDVVEQRIRDLITEMIDSQMPPVPGLLTMPSGFASVPFSLHRQLDGEITHDFDFTPYQDAPTHIYFDGTAAVSGDGTAQSPHRFWSSAASQVEATDGDIVVHIKNDFSYRAAAANSGGMTIDGKRVSIISDTPGGMSWMTAAEPDLVWTQDAEVWSAPRSAVRNVFSAQMDENGIPVPLYSAATLAECRATADSWWSDGTTVHVNSPTAPSDATHHVGMASVTVGNITLLNGGTLYMEGVGILAGTETGFQASGDGTAIFNNCAFIGGDLRPQETGILGNGLTIQDIQTTLVFDTIAAHAPRDGFNYHYANVPVESRRDCLVVEYNCMAYNLGPYNTEGNNNATSAHEGISVLRVGTVGRDMSGPALADVGGCLSVNYDCHMTGGTRNYLFEGGEAWLYDCRSADPITSHLLLTQDAVLHGEPIPA